MILETCIADILRGWRRSTRVSLVATNLGADALLLLCPVPDWVASLILLKYPVVVAGGLAGAVLGGWLRRAEQRCLWELEPPAP